MKRIAAVVVLAAILICGWLVWNARERDEFRDAQRKELRERRARYESRVVRLTIELTDAEIEQMKGEDLRRLKNNLDAAERDLALFDIEHPEAK